MRVLALDIANHTGWAWGEPGSPPKGGTLEVGADQGELGKAFYDYENVLAGLLDKLGSPQVIAYEAPLTQIKGRPAINSSVTSQRLLGLIAITQMLGYAYGARMLPCQITAVRQHFCGSRSATKDEVWRRCLQCGWRPVNLDEADALATWDYAQGKLKAEALGARRVGRL